LRLLGIGKSVLTVFRVHAVGVSAIFNLDAESS